MKDEKNNIFVFLLVILLLGGCATLDRVRALNRQNLLRLSVGLSKEEALNIMNSSTSRRFTTWDTFEEFTNPYRSEVLQGKDKTLEVVYYYTDIKKQDGAITDDEITPLVFDNDKLIGWGWNFLQDNISKYEIRLR